MTQSLRARATRNNQDGQDGSLYLKVKTLSIGNRPQPRVDQILEPCQYLETRSVGTDEGWALFFIGCPRNVGEDDPPVCRPGRVRSPGFAGAKRRNRHQFGSIRANGMEI